MGFYKIPKTFRRMNMNGSSSKLEMERKILGRCFGNLESDYLKNMALNCAKLIVKESFAKIVTGDFEMPSHGAIEKLINEALKWDFDEERIVADIKQYFSFWSERKVYDEVDFLDDMYEDERLKQLDSIIKTTVKECQKLVKELQKGDKA